LLLLAVAWIAVTATDAQAAKKFSSPYVDLVQATAMTPAGGRPSLAVFLANRTDITLWARVRFQSPAGAAACDSSSRIAPKGRVIIGCPQDTLLADTDYAFTISVYLDSTLARAQDENASSVRFRREDLQAFTELTVAMTLPQTFEHVEAGEHRLLALRPASTKGSPSFENMRGSIEQMAASAQSK